MVEPPPRDAHDADHHFHSADDDGEQRDRVDHDDHLLGYRAQPLHADCSQTSPAPCSPSPSVTPVIISGRGRLATGVARASRAPWRTPPSPAGCLFYV